MLPAYETISALCFQLNGLHLLAAGGRAHELAALGQGAFEPACVRYAFPALGPPRAFFPLVAADDWGNLRRGLEAVDWISSQGLLFPRADAEGLWSDGAREQLFLKELDLSTTMLAYAAAAVHVFPGVRVAAAVEVVPAADFALAPGGDFPARLLSAIPAFQLNAALPLFRTAPLIPQMVAAPRVIPPDALS